MNRRTVSWLVSAVVITIPVVGWLQRDAIFDTFRLRNYTAPAEIIQLADSATMTPDARRLFYVYHPVLEDKATFNSYCADTEQTIVLGCYIQHQGIYLYDVPDERLKGVEEITAAHEMLHAAYDRLGGKERAKIDAWLIDASNKITDERYKQTIENYRKKDPSVVNNEIHSILATEIRELPTELENYYKRYFTNRTALVTLAESYKQEFTRREDEVAAMDAQLSSLKSQIEALNSSLELQQANLKSSYETLLRQKNSGDNQAYNDAVPTYNQQVNKYNTDVNRQRSLVEQYNSLVEERNNLAVEENELIQALDSRSTIETQ